MNANERRRRILSILEKADAPVSASVLAEKLSVSRQIIVSDVALHRASGSGISATPRGYILEHTGSASGFPYIGILASKHTPEQLQEELYTVVDLGGFLIDVTIEHSLYGQLSGPLNIGSRYDADLFIEQVKMQHSKPLSVLTDGIHLHQIGCRDEAAFLRIKRALKEKGTLL